MRSLTLSCSKLDAIVKFVQRLVSGIDRRDATYLANRAAMLDSLAEIDALHAHVVAGGGERQVVRLRERG